MNENLMWPQVLLLLWDINMLNSRKLMSHKTEQLKFFDFDILRQGHMWSRLILNPASYSSYSSCLHFPGSGQPVGITKMYTKKSWSQSFERIYYCNSACLYAVGECGACKRNKEVDRVGKGT